MNRPIIIVALITLLAFVAPMDTACAKEQADQTRIITDMFNRKIKIPVKVKKIACMPGSSYEMVFMLGGKDQIGEVRPDHRVAYPLANLTNPDLINYSSRVANINPKARINIEEFIRIAPDVVIYYNVPDAIRKFEEAGIPVYTYWAHNRGTSLDDAIAEEKRMVRSLAMLLGGKALEKAEKWCRYYDQKVAFIRSRIKEVPENKRPRVYIGNSWGGNALATWGGNTHAFAIRLCGGICVTQEISRDRFPVVSLEQMIAWNPDVIIIDNHGRQPDRVIHNILNDPDWSVIDAVKTKKIHRIPSSVFFLDKGSSKPVYLLWLARKLAPQKFPDVDMVKEMKRYFKAFYHYDLSTGEAEHALKGWDKLS
jgi:iron complex transport system substrate-binding protein